MSFMPETDIDGADDYTEHYTDEYGDKVGLVETLHRVAKACGQTFDVVGVTYHYEPVTYLKSE